MTQCACSDKTILNFDTHRKQTNSLELKCCGDASCDCPQLKLRHGRGNTLQEDFHGVRSLPLSPCSSLSMSSNDHKSLKSYREKKSLGHHPCYNDIPKQFDPMATGKPCYVNDHNFAQLSSYTHRLTTATCPTCSSDASQTLPENECGDQTSLTPAVTVSAHYSQSFNQAYIPSSVFEENSAQAFNSNAALTKFPSHINNEEWKHVQPKPSSETLDIFFGRPHAYESLSGPSLSSVELKISIHSLQEEISSLPSCNCPNLFPYYSTQLPTLLRNVSISANSFLVLEFFIESSSTHRSCKICLPSSLLSLLLSHDLEQIAQTHTTFGHLFKTFNKTMAILELPLHFHDSSTDQPKSMQQAEDHLLLLQNKHCNKKNAELIAFLRITRSNVFTSSLIPKPKHFQYTSPLSMRHNMTCRTQTNVNLSSNDLKPMTPIQKNSLTSSIDHLSERSEQYKNISHEFCHETYQKASSQNETSSFFDSDANSSCFKGRSFSHSVIETPKRRKHDLHLNIPPLKLTHHETQVMACDQHSSKNNPCYTSLAHHCETLSSSCFIAPCSTRQGKELKTLCSCNKTLQVCQASHNFHAPHHMKPGFYSKTSSRTPLLTLMSTSHDEAKSADQTFLHSKKAFLCSICHTSVFNACCKHSQSFPSSQQNPVHNVCSCYAYNVHDDDKNVQYQRFGSTCSHLCKNSLSSCNNPCCSTQHKQTLTFLSELFNHFYFQNQLPSDVFQTIFKYGTFFLFWFILLVCPLKRLFLLL